MVLNKEKQYTAIYFPEATVELKEETYFMLQDIGLNYSKVIQLILPALLTIAKEIRDRGHNHKHYKWGLVVSEVGTDIKLEATADNLVIRVDNGKEEEIKTIKVGIIESNTSKP
jgi:hypothetical protein